MFLFGIFLFFSYLFSTPFVTYNITSILEPDHVLNIRDLASADAIVVLGCGRYPSAPEYGSDIVSECSFGRLVYAADIHQATKLPVLISGGSPKGETISEAELMAYELKRRFVIDTIWLETDSKNTWENAAHSAPILLKNGVNKILLLTDAIHMFRASLVFEKYGFKIVKAPTRFRSVYIENHTVVTQWIPNIHSLTTSYYFFSECIAICWYFLKRSFYESMH